MIDFGLKPGIFAQSAGTSAYEVETLAYKSGIGKKWEIIREAKVTSIDYNTVESIYIYMQE